MPALLALLDVPQGSGRDTALRVAASLSGCVMRRRGAGRAGRRRRTPAMCVLVGGSPRRLRLGRGLALSGSGSAADGRDAGLLAGGMSLAGQGCGSPGERRTPGPGGGRGWSTWERNTFGRLPISQHLPFLLGNARRRPGSSRIPSWMLLAEEATAVRRKAMVCVVVGVVVSVCVCS